ncbi:hypothetical protein QQ991_03175 [Weizmannia coagulans]|uniref:DUF7167 domain-containing protein n=2 Tax=Heyndrickxia TaxID=2837504 RepID=A0AAN0TA50_HEYCO|nr:MULTISPECIES: hypothetical protein [Heyndrickxia]AJO24799.1 hypothetical protein SB48_HM08orf06334 [Heyndrickxia coagulans]AKN53760.1 hypothetical protein AB434_1355 [Heyndrickxia coagulans]MCR4445413.1 hypothetical protein [Heyndrickxia coagulans]MCU6438310.1 hypothetical protein [Heyndrickxia coagulans]MCW8781513.1 hypothetical protein [Heyndrickxia coagulans]
MKKHKFFMNVLYVSGAAFEEIVELPADLTDEEVEEEFKEWIWNNLDVYREIKD